MTGSMIECSDFLDTLWFFGQAFVLGDKYVD